MEEFIGRRRQKKMGGHSPPAKEIGRTRPGGSSECGTNCTTTHMALDAIADSRRRRVIGREMFAQPRIPYRRMSIDKLRPWRDALHYHRVDCG